VPGRSIHRRWPAAVIGSALAIALLASCQQEGTVRGRIKANAKNAVVVTSFNFTESRLLGAIYAFAIQRAGIPVRWRLDLGPRELVQPALEQGLVDVVPEYLGTALTSLEPGGTPIAMSNPSAVRDELARVLRRWHVLVLQPAAAADQNGLAVTRATAGRLRLRTISDLRPSARGLALGGPPECPSRFYCLRGLRTVYGLRFARFVALDSQQQRLAAVKQGVVNVAVMFSTDGYLATGGLVWLTDDRHLQPAENVVPVVSARAVARYGNRLVAALDSVSARLTSNDLIFLNWRVDVAGKDVIAEARAWLERRGLLPRPSAAEG
jgi:osmoprotectant transport system substrate-binding protein